MKNQRFIRSAALISLMLLAGASQALAQTVDQVRWKSTDQVRSVLGEPQTVTSPVGTHASYVLWKYESFTVAFANGKAFHLFKRNSLNNLSIDEKRG